MEQVQYIGLLIIALIVMQHYSFSSLTDLVRENDIRLKYICNKLVELSMDIEELKEALLFDNEEDDDEEDDE